MKHPLSLFPEADRAEIRRIVCAKIRRRTRGHLRGGRWQGGLCRDDLLQVAYTAAWLAYEAYEPGRSRYSRITFLAYKVDYAVIDYVEQTLKCRKHPAPHVVSFGYDYDAGEYHAGGYEMETPDPAPKDALWRIVADLPEGQREAVTALAHGRRLCEVAAARGLTEAGVHYRQQSGLRKLRKRLRRPALRAAVLGGLLLMAVAVAPPVRAQLHAVPLQGVDSAHVYVSAPGGRAVQVLYAGEPVTFFAYDNTVNPADSLRLRVAPGGVAGTLVFDGNTVFLSAMSQTETLSRTAFEELSAWTHAERRTLFGLIERPESVAENADSTGALVRLRLDSLATRPVSLLTLEQMQRKHPNRRPRIAFLLSFFAPDPTEAP
jgi:DNA-directed RNA polymerase specialized sigma24 family protein